MTDPELAAAVRLVTDILGGTVADVLRCRRCVCPAMEVPIAGDPPGPWCRDCRPHRRLDTTRSPWAASSCRYGCAGPAGYYLTPAGDRIGPVCHQHAPLPCHWPPTTPTPERTPAP